MPADRVNGFTESIIREMTRLAFKVNGVNMSQGYPDFPAPDAVKDAAVQAILSDANQYSITWGLPELRQAVADKARAFNGIVADPEAEVTITCGAAEAMISTMLGLMNPGDEVILFEPYFETYTPDIAMVGAKPVFVPLEDPDFTFDPDRLRRAFSKKTRAIVITTPHNPLGKVYTLEELTTIAQLCQEFDVIAITDEIYEYITYDGARHISLASLPGMFERTVTISGFSKTFGVTGWRLGYAIAPQPLSSGLRKAHDFAVVCAPAPFQRAMVEVLRSTPESYYQGLRDGYDRRRRVLQSALTDAGFTCYPPQGAYYIFADFSQISDLDDYRFAYFMAENVGVAAVPGRGFYSDLDQGASKMRFAFCKREDTLTDVAQRLLRLRSIKGARSTV